MQNMVIVFTGLPGTGKTTLSRQAAEALGVTLIAKDDIKEIMYDNIGWSDKEFSGKLARATLSIMEYVVGQHLKNGDAIILESNYLPRLANGTFQAWQKQYGCNIVQVVCRTELGVLANRYLERIKSGNRHPGHADNDGTLESYKQDFIRRVGNGEDQPLDVDGPVRIVDTSDFSTVDVKEIAAWLQEAAGTAAPVTRSY